MDKVIAIDFDGVIHKYSKRWFNGSIYDEPVEGAVEAIKELTDLGYSIIIHTTRQPTREMMDWIHKYFGELPVKVIGTKPKAICYIDDRAIRFTNWKDILNYFR